VTERILEGDCVEVMRGLPSESVDCVVTDPPYGMAYRSNMRASWARFDAIENDDNFDFEWQLAWMKECYRVLKDGSHFYAFCSDHHLGEFRDTARSARFNVKRTLVWCKGGGGIGDLDGDYAHETEFCVFAHKGRRPLTGGRISNVLQVPKVRPADLRHPTEKPVGVLRPLVQKSSAPGEVVLDPFGGSGSTAVACREEGRGFIVIEREPKYVEVTRDRLAQGGLF